MKKLVSSILLSAVLLIFTGQIAKAQTGPLTANVTLNVVLNDVASIVIAAPNNVATLTYAAASDYANGVTITQATAMTTVSNKAYTVTVYAGGDLTKSGSDPISVGDVKVTPTATGSPTGVACAEQAIPIGSSSAAQVISSTVGTPAQTFDLTYSTTDAPKTDFIDKTAGTYTATLTYTITQP